MVWASTPSPDLEARLTNIFCSSDSLVGNNSRNGVNSKATCLPASDKAATSFLPSPPPSRSSTRTSHGGSMSSPLAVNGQAAEIRTCSHCRKQFHRLCDLNKHARSHTRPFKCTFPKCKYRTLGWPTRKELERHINDKHASAPQTYPCLFQPCSYRSKRRSNCKQHMEKTHGWIYLRSKSNAKRLPGCTKDESDAETPKEVTGTGPVIASHNSTKGSMAHKAGCDFLLFPDDSDLSAAPGQDSDGDNELLDLDTQDAQDNQVLIPWTSPNTRLRTNVTFLRRFSQAYEPSDKSAEDDLPIDPRLAQVTHNLDSPSANVVNDLEQSCNKGSEALAAAADVSTETYSSNSGYRARRSSPSCHSEPVFDVSQERSVRERAGGAAAPSQSHVTASSSAAPSGSDNGASQKTTLRPLDLTPLKQTDGDEDDEDRPRKRPKPSPKVEFKDTEMPDIFQSAHPLIYNRVNKALYSSCHSTHKDISTLV